MAQYSVKYKKKVLAYLDKNGIAATMKNFGHSNSVIYRWKQKSETVGFMRKKTKTYTKDEKLEVLNYYFENGLNQTEIEFDINCAVIFKWEKLFREYGVEALSYDGKGRKSKELGNKKNLNENADLLKENQLLRAENEYLKKLDALVREREERERKKK